ncbi:hypothetical protein CYY_001855 [Polysphondylium violaceum]|uniref:BTB domain-containing protein n=1 Tax=Polysphondylium violaceum TaxID=133409 RepID=A0A8J4Q2A5_9MYCE|nr:hypothetical protein CYY_001855 [Polysphondylium violaceum]
MGTLENYFKLNSNNQIYTPYKLDFETKSSLHEKNSIQEIIQDRGLYSTRLVYDSIKNRYMLSQGRRNDLQLSSIHPGYYKQSGITYKNESKFKMSFLHTSQGSEKAFIHWRWNFDDSLSICRAMVVINYALFNRDTCIDWYISTERDIEFNLDNPSPNWKRIPLIKIYASKIFIEKQIDLSLIVSGSSHLNLVVCLSNSAACEKAQLFRKCSSPQANENNPNPMPMSKFPFPFMVDIDLKPRLDNNNNSNISNSSNEQQQQKDHSISSGDLFLEQEFEKLTFSSPVLNSHPMEWSTDRVCQWLFDNGLFTLCNYFHETKKRGSDIFSFNVSNQSNIVKSKWEVAMSNLYSYLGQSYSNPDREKYVEMCGNDPYRYNSILKIYQQDQTPHLLSITLPKASDFILNDQQTSDFQIHIDSGNDVGSRILYVHKSVLTAWSLYFTTLFSSTTFNENKTNKTIFKSNTMDYDSLVVVLNIMYTGAKQLVDQIKFESISSLFNLYIISQSLMITSLMDIFEKSLIWSVDELNCDDILNKSISETCHAVNLYKFCKFYHKLPKLNNK